MAKGFVYIDAKTLDDKNAELHQLRKLREELREEIEALQRRYRALVNHHNNNCKCKGIY